jgi:hypothetical protein
MSYRDDLDALAQRCQTAEQALSTATKDLDDARRLFTDAQARRRLPVLENIQVAAPCHADWNKMSGDERSRHCAECDKDVYNLSGMTRLEAETLLLERAGKLCVRYYRRADGTILTADCPVGQKRRRRRRRVIAATFGAMSAVGAAAAALRGAATMGVQQMVPPVATAPPCALTCGAMAPTPPTPPEHTMGEPQMIEEMGDVSVPMHHPKPKHAKPRKHAAEDRGELEMGRMKR